MALAKRKATDESAMLGGRKVKVVRGGGICQMGEKTALVRGTMRSAMCVSTPGADPRPRWRVAGTLKTTGSKGSRGSHGSRAHATKGKQ
jgi:hypothetical protein